MMEVFKEMINEEMIDSIVGISKMMVGVEETLVENKKIKKDVIEVKEIEVRVVRVGLHQEDVEQGETKENGRVRDIIEEMKVGEIMRVELIIEIVGMKDRKGMIKGVHNQMKIILEYLLVVSRVIVMITL